MEIFIALSDFPWLMTRMGINRDGEKYHSCGESNKRKRKRRGTS